MMTFLNAYIFAYILLNVKQYCVIVNESQSGYVYFNCTFLTYGSTSVDTIIIAGILICVFVDYETYESGVTKCTTGEAI